MTIARCAKFVPLHVDARATFARLSRAMLVACNALDDHFAIAEAAQALKFDLILTSLVLSASKQETMSAEVQTFVPFPPFPFVKNIVSRFRFRFLNPFPATLDIILQHPIPQPQSATMGDDDIYIY